MNRVLPEAECLDEIQTKVFKIFILSIHRHPYSFALKGQCHEIFDFWFFS